MSRRFRENEVAEATETPLQSLLRSRQGGDLRSAIQARRGAIQRKGEAGTRLGVSTPLMRLSGGDAAPLRRQMSASARDLAGRLRAGTPEGMLSRMFERLNPKLAEGAPDTITGTDSTDAPFGALTLRWTGRMSLSFSEIEVRSVRNSEGESTSTESASADRSSKARDHATRDASTKRTESEGMKLEGSSSSSSEQGASAEVPVEGVPVKVDARDKRETRGGGSYERSRTQEDASSSRDERTTESAESDRNERSFGTKATGEGANVSRAVRCTVNWELSYQLNNEDGILASAANLFNMEARQGHAQNTAVLTPKGTHGVVVERDPSRG